jgi:nucleotide-binding universal stress UspA family protein
MRIKTIAVGVTTAAEAAWLLPAACDLGAAAGAHLICVHPVEPFVPYIAADAGVADTVAPVFLAWQQEETAAIKALFEQSSLAAGIAAEWRSQSLSAFGSEMFLTDACRAADLVVLGQAGTQPALPDQVRLQEYLIRHVGRPVLMLPVGYKTAPLGQRLLIGWSDTREANRATHDALSLVAPAAAVDILHVGDDAAAPDSCADLAAMLARHGLQAQIIQRPFGDSIAETLMQAALEQGADMIVTGAFGHSRIYDFVVGAVTRTLLGGTRLPVLFSH